MKQKNKSRRPKSIGEKFDSLVKDVDRAKDNDKDKKKIAKKMEAFRQEWLKI